MPEHLSSAPAPDPLQGITLPKLRALPANVTRRWPRASTGTLAGGALVLARLPIDHSVKPAPFEGGSDVARKRLDQFLRQRLTSYPEDRADPDSNGTSGLSPYLHFGHVSVHEIFARIARKERWSPPDVGDKASGKREGWWNMSDAAEAFLDELVTWRELGFNLCHHRPTTYDHYESVPEWARHGFVFR